MPSEKSVWIPSVSAAMRFLPVLFLRRRLSGRMEESHGREERGRAGVGQVTLFPSPLRGGERPRLPLAPGLRYRLNRRTRPETPFMTDTPPDRLSSNPNSPFYDEAVLARDVGIRFNGVEKTNVEEYCVSEGWIRVTAGASKDRFGNPMTIKLKGKVEPYFRAQEQQD